jgi:hypothetical protein
VTLGHEAAKLGPAGATIARAASDLENQTTLAEARADFGNVNDAVIAYLHAGGLSPGGVRIAYCPMARRSWLQRDGAINNPYFGSRMLDCGAFTK